MNTPSNQQPPSDPRALRRHLRQARRAISISQRQQLDLQICQHLLQLPQLDKPCKIAFYMAGDGEADILHAALSLMKQGHQFYLPIIDSDGTNRLRFGLWQPDCAMKANRFDIAEPDVAFKDQLTGLQLDLIFMPLVGFDLTGNRLGMGGGFYDRTLEFKIKQPSADDPELIGIAYQCQNVEQLNRENWDVPLDGLISEQCYRKFSR
ncbi:5-formyltetrahydrofolate cyclo-ligase [Pelagibaculum spongiae]|uniref:5-formyltetrahydrofolate cyclo-ligase n=1 Tax=Pelagibaculum spongiae TaxID=2080658 RepID=A0A2V1H1B7_9GAMM|nr:5-formyltetrahydrofolate cyclo-ligase [Pelagibaculum spongiae]PVZ72293.1 5-formyltetrahydrofolate cyclo-ligase [Pelagibaculum spongiae]